MLQSLSTGQRDVLVEPSRCLLKGRSWHAQEKERFLLCGDMCIYVPIWRAMKPFFALSACRFHGARALSRRLTLSGVACCTPPRNAGSASCCVNDTALHRCQVHVPSKTFLQRPHAVAPSVSATVCVARPQAAAHPRQSISLPATVFARRVCLLRPLRSR